MLEAYVVHAWLGVGGVCVKSSNVDEGDLV